MVTYVVRVAGREVTVVLDPRRPGYARVDGVEMAVDSQQIGAQPVYSLLLDGQSYGLVLDDRPGEALRIGLGGRLHEVEVEDERARALAAVAGHGADGDAATPVKAPMPGLVVSVAVAEGDQVTAHQRLLILEAMKMENELRAPRAGRIKTVRVAAGEKVEQGRLLVVIE